MPAWVLAVAVARVKEQRCRRVRAGELPVIPGISRRSINQGFVHGQDRQGGVIAVQAPTKSAWVDASSSMPSRAWFFALPVERLAFAKLGVKDRRQSGRLGMRRGSGMKGAGDGDLPRSRSAKNRIVRIVRATRPGGDFAKHLLRLVGANLLFSVHRNAGAFCTEGAAKQKSFRVPIIK
jgi:hypothetical protein